jgi:hypothetical protein
MFLIIICNPKNMNNATTHIIVNIIMYENESEMYGSIKYQCDLWRRRRCRHQTYLLLNRKDKYNIKHKIYVSSHHILIENKIHHLT